MVDRAMPAGTPSSGAARAFAFALLCLAAGRALAASPGLSPWTSQDLEQAAEAAMATAISQSNDGGTQASSLVRVAIALVHAGDTQRAKAMLLRAGALCGPPSFMTMFARGDVVDRLARLGDDADAEMLANVDADPPIQATLLGKLGTGRASAGDIAGAKAAANAIAALPASTAASPAVLANAKAAALADIAIALDAADAIDDALHIADGLPDGVPKVQILAGVARGLCKAHPKDGNRVEHGGLIARQAVASAKSAPADPNMPAARTLQIEIAAEAIADCEGPAPARDLIDASLALQQAWRASGAVSDLFRLDGDLELARAMAPIPMPDDAGQLLNAAQRASRLQDPEQASALARRAARIAVNHDNLLFAIFDVLVEQGDYDDAIATVQPMEVVRQKQLYVTLVATEARHGATAALASSLPKAIEIVKAPTAGIDQTGRYLSDMTLALARAGYREQAQLPYRELQAASRDPSVGRPVDPATLARLQAAMGDLPGALEAADLAGPLVVKPGAMQAVLPTIMAFDGARQRPTPAEIETMLERLKRALPDLVPGPKANVLSMIAADLAAGGDVDAAIHVEAGLEDEPRDVLRGPRDRALAAIASAQVRAGNPEASLSTALRISQPALRLERLIELANLPPRL